MCPPPDEPRGRVGQTIAGKWRVDERIGSGGMATVYSATHRNGARAALKMLHAPLSRDPAVRARFLREGYVANSVGHDGVVQVLDDGVTDDGAAFLVLELLEGETIDARRHALGGRIPMDEALDIGMQLLEALAAAHEKGIVHRDVKPENVFLTVTGKVKILDFGLAHMRDAGGEATKTGVTIGTPEFMPPEQAQGRRDRVDPRSDVWMVGATLFTIITGSFVHEDAETIHEALIASATRRPRPVSELAPQLPAAVAQVIDRALELEMEDRWESAVHMAQALVAARESAAQSHGGKYDSATAFAPAMDTSRRNMPLSPDDNTMQDSQPTDVHSGELDLEPTLVPQPRHKIPQPPGTTRMSNRPPGHAGHTPRGGEFRPPMQTPSEEHETYSAPPRSVPPPPVSHSAGRNSHGPPPGSLPPPPMPPPGSMPPSIPPAHPSQRPAPPNLTPIHDQLEPTPILSVEQSYDAYRAQLPTIPPEAGLRPPPARGQSQKETIALIALALFFLCAAMGAYMMRRPR